MEHVWSSELMAEPQTVYTTWMSRMPRSNRMDDLDTAQPAGIWRDQHLLVRLTETDPAVLTTRKLQRRAAAV